MGRNWYKGWLIVMDESIGRAYKIRIDQEADENGEWVDDILERAGFRPKDCTYVLQPEGDLPEIRLDD